MRLCIGGSCAVCLLSILACDDAVTPRAESGPPAVSAPEPPDCLETTTYANGKPLRTHMRLDTERRVITSFRDDGSKMMAWRYDDAARLVARAGFRRPQSSNAFEEFQHDYRYDSRGNQTEFRLSYPQAANIEAPSDAETYSGVRIENAYDASGALIRSTLTPSGSDAASRETRRILFHENAAHQCDRIENVRADGTSSSVETRDYDALGRPSRADLVFAPTPVNGESSTYTTMWTYDERGRTTVVREWFGGTAPESNPGRVTTTTYRADGTIHVDRIDDVTDITDERTIVVERSAHCAEVDAWRDGSRDSTHPTGTRCSF